ncbi:hypothetical protein R4P48_17305 [Atlantibacter subterranea]|uniref:Uncharacterized protein n=1 Tax=Atlantibacter subterraneus TaxID=255519 RepID=A0ABU4E6V4_9ENTR|nr:hypothetical protein [Atlantibacter subterranea]MDV7024431.1 hypothetical protein [Atlantibacter subterranea]MDZ5667527.1 hypothetical protein [Atlantibacter hermannii]
MKRILVFINSQPVEVIRTFKAVNIIRREQQGGMELHLPVRFAGIHYVGQRRTEIFVASDKELTSDEIITAANSCL